MNSTSMTTPDVVNAPKKRGRKPGTLSRSARESQRKINHSRIEKARRSKINDALDALRSLVPAHYGKDESPPAARSAGGGKQQKENREFKLDILERTVLYVRDLVDRVHTLEQSLSATTSTILSSPSAAHHSSNGHVHTLLPPNVRGKPLPPSGSKRRRDVQQDDGEEDYNDGDEESDSEDENDAVNDDDDLDADASDLTADDHEHDSAVPSLQRQQREQVRRPPSKRQRRDVNYDEDLDVDADEPTTLVLPQRALASVSPSLTGNDASSTQTGRPRLPSISSWLSDIDGGVVGVYPLHSLSRSNSALPSPALGPSQVTSKGTASYAYPYTPYTPYSNAANIGVGSPYHAALNSHTSGTLSGLPSPLLLPPTHHQPQHAQRDDYGRLHERAQKVEKDTQRDRDIDCLQEEGHTGKASPKSSTHSYLPTPPTLSGGPHSVSQSYLQRQHTSPALGPKCHSPVMTTTTAGSALTTLPPVLRLPSPSRRMSVSSGAVTSSAADGTGGIEDGKKTSKKNRERSGTHSSMRRDEVVNVKDVGERASNGKHQTSVSVNARNGYHPLSPTSPFSNPHTNPASSTISSNGLANGTGTSMATSVTTASKRASQSPLVTPSVFAKSSAQGSISRRPSLSLSPLISPTWTREDESAASLLLQISSSKSQNSTSSSSSSRKSISPAGGIPQAPSVPPMTKNKTEARSTNSPQVLLPHSPTSTQMASDKLEINTTMENTGIAHSDRVRTHAHATSLAVSLSRGFDSHDSTHAHATALGGVSPSACFDGGSESFSDGVNESGDRTGEGIRLNDSRERNGDIDGESDPGRRGRGETHAHVHDQDTLLNSIPTPTSSILGSTTVHVHAQNYSRQHRLTSQSLPSTVPPLEAQTPGSLLGIRARVPT